MLLKAFYVNNNMMQRIQYAKTKSDCIAKEEGSYVPREKKKKQEEKGKQDSYIYSFEARLLIFPIHILELLLSFMIFCW